MVTVKHILFAKEGYFLDYPFIFGITEVKVLEEWEVSFLKCWFDVESGN